MVEEGNGLKFIRKETNLIDLIRQYNNIIVSVLENDAYKEEYCKELWQDERRKIESSSYVDGQLVAFSYFMPVMVDVRTALFVERMNKRGFQLNCFQASNVDAFFEKLTTLS